jgi:hypothetical protein
MELPILIRDEDTNFFTRPDMLKQSILKRGIKVSLNYQSSLLEPLQTLTYSRRVVIPGICVD